MQAYAYMLDNAVTDAELVERLKARDAEAYREVITRYGNGLYRYLYGLTSNHHMSEDIVGDVYLRMLENIDNYICTGAPFKSWLFRIAHNLALNALKRSSRTTNIDNLAQIEMSSARPEDSIIKDFDSVELQEALSCLTDEQRHVIVLRFVSGQSIREVAETLEKSETAVKQLQLRAVRALARHLKPGLVHG